MNDQDKPLDYSKLPSSILEVEKLESGLSLTNKRDHERLDYKKLYEDSYCKSSSDSSDDEDWNEMSTPKKLMKIDNKKVEEKLNEAFQENQNPSEDKKQELAQELGMTSQKVSRWFESARCNSRISSNESSIPITSSPDRAEASGIHKLDIAAADKTPGDKVATLKSCASPMKPNDGIDLKSPEIPTANGDASNEKE